MDAQAILQELTYAEGLPKEALKAASAQRGEMVPLFLEEIETYLVLEPAGQSRRHCSSFFICSESGGRKLLIGSWPGC